MTVNVKENTKKLTHLAEVGLILSPLAMGLVSNNAHISQLKPIKAHATVTNGNENAVHGTDGMWVYKPVDGYYEFCLDAGILGPDAGYEFTPMQWNVASRIVAFGQNAVGKTPLAEGMNGGIFANMSEAQKYDLTQLTVWKFTNPANAIEEGAGKTASQILDGQGWGARAQALYDTAMSKDDPNFGVADANANADSLANQAQNDAQVSLTADVNQKLSAWKDSAMASMTEKVNSEVASDKASGIKSAQTKVQDMVHLTDAKLVTADADKKALPNFEDGSKNAHSDSVKEGAHVFGMNFTHDDPSTIGPRTTVDFGTGGKIHFASALPKDTVIENNGKVLTQDASKTQDYDVTYGSIQISVPFSDKPAEASDTLNAKITAIGSYTTNEYSEAASSSVNVTASGTVQGQSVDQYEGYEAIQEGRQRFVIVTHSSTTTTEKPWNASASGSDSASYASSETAPWSQEVNKSLGFKWNSMLTNLKIHKVDENGNTLRGVTFELVASSVTDHDILVSGPGKYTLSQGDGALISLPKVTDKDGNISWDNLAFPGVYTLLEIATNDGKILASNPVDITADRYHVDNQNLKVVNKNGSLTIDGGLSSHSDATPSNPTIHTTATGTNGTKLVLGAGKQPISDTVTYENLKPNHKYHLVGKFVDQDTGKEIEDLTGSKDFTTTDANGQVDVQFIASDASKYAGKHIVAYEYLYDEDKPDSEVAKHEDIKDSGQALQVTKPEIHTTATVDGNKTILPSGDVTVKDEVEYSGMVPGVEITLEGSPVNKNDSKVIGNGGQTTFTPKDEKGTESVQIKADASKMGSKGMVMFEKAHQGDKSGQVIATHEDINDAGQTISPKPVTVKGSTPTTPGVGSAPLAQTAIKDSGYISLIALGTITLATGLAFATSKKRKA